VCVCVCGVCVCVCGVCMCVCVCYFNNIYIITTPACFDTFVSSSWTSKVLHRLSYVDFMLPELIEIIQLKFLIFLREKSRCVSSIIYYISALNRQQMQRPDNVNILIITKNFIIFPVLLQNNGIPLDKKFD